MKLNTEFNGRVVQIVEALDYGDAVSNQVLELHKMMERMGLQAYIYSKWHHEKVADSREDLDSLELSERDIVLFHFSGYSEFAMPKVLEQYCTKVLVYHNITPHEFFTKGSKLYEHCRKGREQLAQVAKGFHYFWGDSKYNLDELQSLGVEREKCSVIPIVVPTAVEDSVRSRESGCWIFLGRIAANKRQLELIELFSQMRAESPEFASKLYLVGGFDVDDPYYNAVADAREKSPFRELIVLTGKVSDEDLNLYFARAHLYVCLSAHEGFGVPLIESPLRGVPVVAIDSSAISETMNSPADVAASVDGLRKRIRILAEDQFAYEEAVARQKENARRFAPATVDQNLRQAFAALLPARRRYKTLSVIICTYNRRDYLERCLDYLGFQTNPNFEVIVVNGPSDDGTDAVLSRFQGRVRIANNPTRNLSISRNLGIESAQGDLVAFIDDDAIPFADWVDSILRTYNRLPLTVAGLGGPAYYAGTFWFQAEDNGINKLAEARVNIPHEQIGKNGWSRYNTGTNATFVRSALVEVGGFDEQFDYYLDESELCFRLQNRGALIGYSDQIIVRHEFAQSHNRLGRHNYNWFTICKNTAYFIAAYSGLQGEQLKNYVADRMERERVSPLDAAVEAGELAAVDRDKHVEAVRAGARKGLADASEFPRTRRIEQVAATFLRYELNRENPTVGNDVGHLHICIVSKELPPFAPGGGIGTLYYHLASELLILGHSVTAIVPATEDRVFKQGRITVHFVKPEDVNLLNVDVGFARNLSWSLACLKKLAQISAERRVDVVDSALWDAEALAIAMLPSQDRPAVVVRLVTPYLVATRTNGWTAPPEVTSLFVNAEKTLLDRADAVVPISESIATTIEREYGLSRDARWSLAHCGIAYWPFFDVNKDYSEFQELDGVPPGALESSRLIVFVGRLERRKGVDILLSAAEKILNADPRAVMLIAGRDVEGLAVKLGPQKHARLHFLGEVPDATREKLLAKAYCAVFPSRYESFGLVPLEAFVHGVPVVASRSGAIPEVVEHEKCGLLFKAEDADDLARSVVRLLTQEGLRESLSGGARRQIRRFSGRNSALKAIALYETLVRDRQ